MDHALVKGAECREHSRDMPSVNTINPRYIFHFMNEFAEALPVAVAASPIHIMQRSGHGFSRAVTSWGQ